MDPNDIETLRTYDKFSHQIISFYMKYLQLFYQLKNLYCMPLSIVNELKKCNSIDEMKNLFDFNTDATSIIFLPLFDGKSCMLLVFMKESNMIMLIDFRTNTPIKEAELEIF